MSIPRCRNQIPESGVLIPQISKPIPQNDNQILATDTILESFVLFEGAEFPVMRTIIPCYTARKKRHKALIKLDNPQCFAEKRR